MKTQLILMACLSLLGTTGCDLPDKNIGDETMGGGGQPGDDCEPGEDIPAADGCNTCTCQDDGTLACTEIGCGQECEPGTTVPADDGCNTCECLDDGTVGGCTKIGCDPGCEPGVSVPAPDGCNMCECLDDGTVGGCTEIACEPPTCEPGTTVPADDGCNVCECNDDGTIGACTEVACEPADTDPFDGPELSSCEDSTPFDGLVINDVTLAGDTLTLDVAYTGCGPGHPLGGCWDGSYDLSSPVQVGIAIAHDDLAEACDAFPSDSFQIDLTPLRETYIEDFGEAGDIAINIPGWGETILYSF